MLILISSSPVRAAILRILGVFQSLPARRRDYTLGLKSGARAAPEGETA